MSYYFSTVLKDVTFQEAIDKTKSALKEEGFGVLTEIDMKATLKEKMGVDFSNYLILGACNPPFAYKALMAENKIGTMLPCNVIVRENGDGSVEIAAVNPIASMSSVENKTLFEIATEVEERMKRVIQELSKP